MEFYDSYAFIEIIESGKIHFSQEAVTLTTNLAEVYYSLLRVFNKKTADHFFKQIKEITQDVPKELIPEAMQFRFVHKKKKFSYIDALGYVYARKHNLPFVTGDQEFKGLKGVRLIR